MDIYSLQVIFMLYFVTVAEYYNENVQSVLHILLIHICHNALSYNVELCHNLEGIKTGLCGRDTSGWPFNLFIFT